MRSLLTSTAVAAAMLHTIAVANAADVIVDVPQPPVVADVPFNWTGFYAGVQGGYAFSDIESDDLDTLLVGTGVAVDVDANGFLAGVHAGYNAQFGRFVLGAYVDADYAQLDLNVDLTSSGGILPPFGVDGTVATLDGYVARGMLKAGAAFDRTLVYAQGGIAFADFEVDSFLVSGIGAIIGGFGGGSIGTISTDEVGFAVGAGVDFAVTDNVVLGADYLFHRFDDLEFESDLGSLQTDAELDVHTLRAKISYKF